uniref:LRRCT domain-containing protein n=1 Tax=Syphacia muris TaxID=451379 RepID=A0A0N5AQ88_9BILA
MQHSAVQLFCFALVWLTSTAAAFCPTGCRCGESVSGAYSVNCDGSYMDEISPLLNPRTRKLSLRGCGIVGLNKDVLQLYPELEYLDVSDNFITEIDEDVFQGCENLRVLKLQNNRIRIIRNATFIGLLNLQELDLSYNRIEKIARNAFKVLNGLIELDLSNNYIVQLHSMLFSKCVQLRKLHLFANKLSKINDQILKSLSKLEYLDLSFNLITSIDRSAFQHCISLRDLNLTSNLLHFLHFDLFSSLYWLVNLQLNDNQLNETSCAAFRRISTLTTLDLSKNQFTRLPPSCFDDLEVLDTLLLSNQFKLQLIENNAFSDLRRLRHLNISNCQKLQEINEGAFEYSDELRILDLSNCSIKKLHFALVQWNKITSLDLSGNKLNCDCALLSFLPRVVKRLQSNVSCSTPSRLEGKKIADLEAFCMEGRSESRISVVAVVIVGLIFIAVAIYCLLKKARKRVVKLPSCSHSYIVTPLTFDKNYEISKSNMNLLRRYNPMLTIRSAPPPINDDPNVSYYSSLILPNDPDGVENVAALRPERKPTPPLETTIPQPPLITLPSLANRNFRVISQHPIPITEL